MAYASLTTDIHTEKNNNNCDASNWFDIWFNNTFHALHCCSFGESHVNQSVSDKLTPHCVTVTNTFCNAQNKSQQVLNTQQTIAELCQKNTTFSAQDS